uniref:Uncharacterized protein n=1 Tax=Anopheles dirus TaxID=7168 RepID=A0A182NWS6_9DIPT
MCVCVGDPRKWFKPSEDHKDPGTGILHTEANAVYLRLNCARKPRKELT